MSTWLITGCSTGFGRALAEELLARGETVVATARNPDALAGLDGALRLQLDVTRPDDIAAAVAAAGAIDVLVNNAGYGQIGTVEDTPIEAARAAMETNYFGALAMIRAVLPGMLERGSGRIVNVGSVAGQIGFAGLGYYSAAKFALAGLTESLGAELAGTGVTATLAELGPFATDFTRAMQVVPPSPRYDMAALAEQGGNAGWGSGDDPRRGARSLLDALAHPAPPRRLILGKPGLAVIELHDKRRAEERARWLPATCLEP